VTRKPGRPKQFSIVIRKRDSHPEEAEIRLVTEVGLDKDHALERLASSGRIDLSTEEVVGIDEDDA
jgi:hypothetical protein